MKNTLSYIVIIALAVAFTSCNPYTLVNSETYNDADLASYNTFSIITPDTDHHLPPGMQMVTYYNIAAAIREQMVERGYTETPDSPLLINIGLTVHKEIATEPAYPFGAPLPPDPYFGPYYGGFAPYYMYPRYSYYPYNPNAQVITGIYKEGVLTMDIVNIKTMTPLYSASVSTIMDPGSGRFCNLSGIAEAVNTLFSKFPVPLLPQYKH